MAFTAFKKGCLTEILKGELELTFLPFCRKLLHILHPL